MSKNETKHLDLPALSADESAHSSGNMTDTSTSNDQTSEQFKDFTQQHQQQPFMDHSFFYNLDQIANENPLYFMQQQHQQQQPNVLFQNQFLKGESSLSENNSNKSLGVSTSTLAHSIATSMESFQNAITSSVGEQPPSFWAGLNNFISNVTHNNLFPAFPNIARSFSEYLANHPVPFLSSFNAPTISPIASPMPSSSLEFDPMLQFKQECEKSETGLQIRVLGVAQSGAKSRVETQIKLCIQLVTDGGDKAQWWSHLKLPEHMVTKDKSKKTASITASDHIDHEKLLYLQARVLCASDPSKKVTTCYSCIQRERKRSQRRKQQQNNADDTEDERTDDDSSLATDEQRILLFNCSELVDFSAGDTILPTRITCYCRHHNEKLGFCIYFEMLDHTGKKVAEGISPPIMITDDHKSNKIKAGSKRRRAESEVLPEPRIPSLSWIKSSLPFSNIKTEPSSSSSSSSIVNQFPPPPPPPPSSSSSYTAAEMADLKSELKSILTNTAIQQQQQSQQYIYSLNSNNTNNNNRIAPLITQPQPSSASLPPTMKRLIPNEAPTSGNIEITILGTDFRPGMTVMFGDSPATNIQYWSPNTLICTLPPSTQPGAVVVSFKGSPSTTDKMMVFTYLVETDRALMELALQVVGMKMTGIVEDARKIAMRIVQGNNPSFESSQNTSKEASSSLSKLMSKAESSSSTNNNHPSY